MEKLPSEMPLYSENINETFLKLSEKADILYRFVALYSNYIAQNRNYGVGPDLTMTESHMLNSIVLTPGVTVTNLARRWERSKGAVCQVLTKLEKKGLSERRKSDSNGKNVLVYPTELGLRANDAHMVCDVTDILATTQELLKSCTMDEINAFYKVLDLYTGYLRAEQ